MIVQFFSRDKILANTWFFVIFEFWKMRHRMVRWPGIPPIPLKYFDSDFDLNFCLSFIVREESNIPVDGIRDYFRAAQAYPNAVVLCLRVALNFNVVF